MYTDKEKQREAKRKWWAEHKGKKLEPTPLEPAKLEPLLEPYPPTDYRYWLTPPEVNLDTPDYVKFRELPAMVQHGVLKVFESRRNLGLFDDSKERIQRAWEYSQRKRLLFEPSPLVAVR